MHVLILGASGSFGRAAHHAFARAGHSVALFDRSRVDLFDATALTRAFEGIDVVVNALNPPYDQWEDVVPGYTRAIAAAAKETGSTVLLPGNVYNFGTSLPEHLDETTPQVADTGKGRIRIDLERIYRDAGTRTIILRCGDFVATEPSGNWMDTYILDAKKRTVTYPGPSDLPHAWAFLPDAARAAVALCGVEDRPAFLDVPFPGWTLSGAEVHAAAERAAGATLKRKSFPWWFLALASPFAPTMREVREMRYLWNRPHRLDGSLFRTLVPDFRHTSPEEGLRPLLRP